MAEISIDIKDWSSLTLDEFHDLTKLRIDVFVVEQNCPYPELDGWDKRAIHFIAKDNDKIIGVARLFEPSVKREEAVLGRLAIDEAYRGQGLSSKLLDKRIEYIREKYPEASIFSGVQSYRTASYEKRNFRAISEEYLEDGLPHIDMLLKAA